ncbi:hypothetical protein IGI04_039824 [Brassica rapa subsp. trilocularis]|uniref:Zinc finger GRF-type domain-containing protein n=1 Tax=Brassica rapa subsp. trilocularis TaxID=1813537 RepID=A0ABQ7KLX8_BRACM|nr:hypothetical protein IGI04_039824 [Brassica rapa subsp. trilocularis]
MTHPAEEYRQMKAWKRDTNMLGCVADAKCGIPTRCPCGGTIINEVSRNLKYPTDFDTLPEKKYFTCKNYENDGFHFRQPWVFGVQEEVEMLRKRVDAMAAEIAELKYNLTRQNPTTP